MTATYVDHAHRHRPGASDPLWLPGAAYEIKVFADDAAVTTGDGKFKFAIPADLDAVKLTAAHAFVTTASSSGLPTVQIRNVTQAVDMLSTRITIDVGEKTSYDPDFPPTVPPVVDATHATVAQGDEIAVDVDVAGTGAKGLGVILVFGSPPGGANVGPPGETGDTGPPGPAGPPGASYTHTQAGLSATWVIVHGLGVYPSVSVVDTGDSVILPDVHYDNANQVTLTFGAATSGKAFLN